MVDGDGVVEAEVGRVDGRAAVVQHAHAVAIQAADTATPSYTRLDLWARGALTADERLGWFAKLVNVSNELAYNAAAVATVRGLSPLPGRALTVGLNARW